MVNVVAEKDKYRSKNIKHSLDVWHVAKNMAKKLLKVGNRKFETDISSFVMLRKVGPRYTMDHFLGDPNNISLRPVSFAFHTFSNIC